MVLSSVGDLNRSLTMRNMSFFFCWYFNNLNFLMYFIFWVFNHLVAFFNNFKHDLFIFCILTFQWWFKTPIKCKNKVNYGRLPFCRAISYELLYVGYEWLLFSWLRLYKSRFKGIKILTFKILKLEGNSFLRKEVTKYIQGQVSFQTPKNTLQRSYLQITQKTLILT